VISVADLGVASSDDGASTAITEAGVESQAVAISRTERPDRIACPRGVGKVI
jgi:hypothetical protein